jgi:hypothetical protein
MPGDRIDHLQFENNRIRNGWQLVWNVCVGFMGFLGGRKEGQTASQLKVARDGVKHLQVVLPTVWRSLLKALMQDKRCRMNVLI